MVRSLIFGRSKNFSFLQSSSSAYSGHMRVVKWYRGSFSAVKAVRIESDHSHPSTAQFKNKWSYTSNPLFVFVGYTEKNLPFCTRGSAVVLGLEDTKVRVQQSKKYFWCNNFYTPSHSWLVSSSPSQL